MCGVQADNETLQAEKNELLEQNRNLLLNKNDSNIAQNEELKNKLVELQANFASEQESRKSWEEQYQNLKQIACKLYMNYIVKI